MRTTIDIPNELMKKAKIKAAEEGITLKELFVKSLTSELEKPEMKKSHQELLEDLRGSIISMDVGPEDSGFEDFEPESEFFFHVNEPGSSTKKNKL